MYEETKEWAARFDETPFDYKCRTIAEEVFRVAEWVTLTAAIAYVGVKFSSPIATAVYYLLLGVLALYLGQRIPFLLSGLLGKKWMLRHHWLVLTAIAAPVSASSVWLVRTLIDGLIKVQAA